tara:strand:- start:5254 stop:6198 length:945 start_codon:yes stop_codon:yes gene_type:complete
MNSNKPKHLVTGGAGFLGSHLIDRLIKKGEEVICIDNYSTGQKDNIIHWFNHPNFEFIRHDITEPIQLEVNNIWHFACPASPVHYQANPIKTSKTIFLGTYNMLGLAKRTNSKFILASTSEIYGDPEIHPQPESYRGYVNPIGPRSCYDEGKRMAEALTFDYKRIHNVDAKILRIFNTYGPRMHPKDGRVISNFIFQALNKKNLTVYGNGKQTRSFCYVDDLIDGIIKFMSNDYAGPLNLGNPCEYTILEIANIIKNKINKNLDIKFFSLPKDDPCRRKPLIELAKNKINWTPNTSFDKGIDLTIEYFKNLENF